MAKFTVKSTGFQLCPEGRRVFKITKVDDSNYEKFGELEIHLQDKKGNTHKETYRTITNDGEANDGACKALSFLISTALNNFELEGYEVELQDIVNHYIEGEIKHEDYTSKKDGKTYKNARFGDIKPATNFDKDTISSVAKKKAKVEEESTEDIDDFLKD